MPILERKIIHGVATVCSHISYPRFVLPLHKHVEFEIMLFTQGNGKQFVGEGVSEYRAGDIALIGSNVPHLHLCDSKLHPISANGQDNKWSAGEAIQFRPDMFPENMKDIPDYRFIYDLLQKSQYGIRFYDEGVFDEMLGMVRVFDSSEYTSRLVCLLRMLEKLHDCRHFKLLSDTAYNQANHIPDVKEPVNKVYAYLYNHFKEKVTLGGIAEFVKQNPTALCRYFKQRTDKSIFQCLAEIRIEHACKLLAYSKMNVSQIAYESGYNSVTHFIAQFEKITRQTPSEYRTRIKL
ncbi:MULTISPECIES: AraC family transcriptional regulator [Bacteroidales]|jgi:transcriptional regulator, AraC family|uniref:AraC family transcriptional regulator n=1 Tax=Bacteroidales TaxID=171549 RepID=UPI000575A31A|nr:MULTISPECIES: AraC family transcriptional regulator [Bacteroidales]KHM44408.1 AraC family transcriptional regulator [Coprobacter secundus]